MPDPITATIEHKLGREEAVRRIKSGIDQYRGALNSVASIRKELWTEDCLSFSVSAFGKECEGIIRVQDDIVRIELILPGAINFIASRLLVSVQKIGRQVLLGNRQ